LWDGERDVRIAYRRHPPRPDVGYLGETELLWAVSYPDGRDCLPDLNRYLGEQHLVDAVYSHLVGK